MSTKKMLVVTLKRTKAVLAAVTRNASGVPAIADIVGDGLIVREIESTDTLKVPPDELDLREVDANESPFLTPQTQAVNDSGQLEAVPAPADVTFAIPNVTITIPATPAVPASKAAVIVIDAGANSPALAFTGNTGGGGSGTIVIPVNGIPTGAHLVVASVAGYGSIVKSVNF